MSIEQPRMAAPALDSGPPKTTLRLVSVCTVLPVPQRPQQGRFVERRLRALARLANLTVLQPVPWFPMLRPWNQNTPHVTEGGRRCEPEWPELSRPIDRCRMFYVPRFFKQLDARWLERSILPNLRRLIAVARPDALDAHFGYPEGVGCVRAGERLGIPVFITVRGNEVHYLRHPQIGPRLAEALQRCAGVVAVSHALRDEVVRCGVDSARVRVIPNAVDTALFRPGDRAAARASLGVAGKSRMLLSIANQVREKGLHLLIEALSAVQRDAPDCEVYLIGAPANERDYPVYLRQRAADLGLSRHVHFLGAQPPEQVATWLQAADLFVLPTYREGCNNSIIESLACGVPVVTTPVGENPWFVTPPFNGCLVPVGEVEALAAGITRALRQEWDQSAIAERVARSGDWGTCARSTLAFFEQQLRGRG